MKVIGLALTFIVIATNCFAQSIATEEISFQNQGLKLFGEIFIPENEEKRNIGLAVIQGSGHSDRSNQWARMICELLAKAGYHVLIPDKRGTGLSDGDWKKSSFIEIAIDAGVSAKALKEAYQLNKVGVIGLSQGGRLAPVCALEFDIDFVINLVGSAVSFEEQMIHEIVNTSKSARLSNKDVREVVQLHALMKAYVQNRDWKPLDSAFRAIQEKPWSEFAKSFPQDPNIWVWDWLELNLSFDPIEYWSDVQQDVLIVYGSQDEHKNVPVFQSVYRLDDAFTAKGKKNYSTKIYPTGHDLFNPGTLEFNSEFVTDLLSWLDQQN